MSNSKRKNWGDTKMVIATLSVTLTLAFWHIFASASNQPDSTTAVVNLATTTMPLEPAAGTTQPRLVPFDGTILFGGAAPQPRVVVRSGGGGGGGGGGITTTTSS